MDRNQNVWTTFRAMSESKQGANRREKILLNTIRMSHWNLNWILSWRKHENQTRIVSIRLWSIGEPNFKDILFNKIFNFCRILLFLNMYQKCVEGLIQKMAVMCQFGYHVWTSFSTLKLIQPFFHKKTPTTNKQTGPIKGTSRTVPQMEEN